MNKISYISLVAGVLMLNGCYEDKGHYDYTPTNGITFEVNPQIRRIIWESVIFILQR